VNDHGKLIVKPLPTEAQFSTVNGIIVQDFDQDGIKDILLAGNKFDVEVETTAADASPGLLLKGRGDLTYKSVKPFESGFFVPYNVKDIQPIKTQEGWAILVGINNTGMRVFQTSHHVKSQSIARK
jgi:hypothetical protein